MMSPFVGTLQKAVETRRNSGAERRKMLNDSGAKELIESTSIFDVNEKLIKMLSSEFRKYNKDLIGYFDAASLINHKYIPPHEK